MDGVKSPKSGRNKFFFEMKVLENKPLLPSRLRKLAKQLEDYPFAGLEVQGLSGTVEKSGDGFTLKARASGQKYVLVPSEDLKRAFEAGTRQMTVSGRVTQKEDSDPVTLEVTESKETPR
ncbi:MAG TPA: hypothetical protein VEN81_06140 [Planctomycetota bacterium]|nr:hypothetical protein [Planctomycetota bacterium]